MRRYFYEGFLAENSTALLKGEIFKHIFRVCRHKEGEQFELLSGGRAFLVEALEIQKSEACVKILSERQLPSIPKPYVHLVLANPKPAVFASVLEKMVELNVKSVRPLISQNSFFKSLSRLEQKEKRFERIVKQAMQQSGRGESLDILPSKRLDEFLYEYRSLCPKKNVGYVFYEDKALWQKRNIERKGVENIYVLVGGEGGLTLDEVKSAYESGLLIIHLGHQILRVETACVAGISILKSKFKVW